MTVDELASFLDHTILRPDVTRKEIEKFINEAVRYPFASLCIPPLYVPLAAELLENTDMSITSVVGFPLGWQSMSTKLFEAEEIQRGGGNEIDMVMNIGALKGGEHHIVADEIRAIVMSCRGMTVKVIIETCLLSDTEKAIACRLIAWNGAHFVKTSTGFSRGGATVEDVILLKEASAGRLKVKASGGISDLDAALRFIEAGASRIGTSSGVKILEELRARQ